MVVVVDYGRGNLFSIGQALRHLDAEFEVTAAPERIAQADRIVLPGVGAFSDAMKGLGERGLIAPLKAAAAAGAPMLGICVGCQMLLSRSEEFGDHAGLDLIPGTVTRLPEPRAKDAAAIRIPNVGWRPLTVSAVTPVLGGIGEGDMMYFVHSYAPMARDSGDVAATISVNGRDVPAVVAAGNLVGVQFHPEKSGPPGLGVLRRFLEMNRDGRDGRNGR